MYVSSPVRFICRFDAAANHCPLILLALSGNHFNNALHSLFAVTLEKQELFAAVEGICPDLSRLKFNSLGGFGLQRHPALGTVSRGVLPDFRMHGAGVGPSCGLIGFVGAALGI